MRITLILSFLSIFFFTGCTGNRHQEKKKLRVLILTGKSNHDWEKSTYFLLKTYRKSGRFSASMTTRPDTLDYAGFSHFDAVVSNFTAFPDRDYRWPAKTEKGLMRFIEEGGGFVLFHAASAAFYNWDEFQELIGSTWGDSTRHGKVIPHKVIITDKTHPVTKGMKDFWITDELWVNTLKQPGIKVLAVSVSDISNNGRGLPEPVVICSTKGKGRCFHNILGHGERAFQNTGWQTLMLRGTEWAATGKVTIPLPKELQAGPEEPQQAHYSWRQTDTTFALLKNKDVVWQYNFNTRKGKPFFHPVKVGLTDITAGSPPDHPWHPGLWFSWKKLNGKNYWEYLRGKGIKPWNYEGITQLKSINPDPQNDHSCTFRLKLLYHEKNKPAIMSEKRTVYVSPPEANGTFFIDYDFIFTALTDSVVIDRTPLQNEKNGKSWGGYAGLAIRFNADCWQPSFLNPDGSTEKKQGGRYAWKYYGFRTLTGKKIGVTIFDHPQNINYPTPWYVGNNERVPFCYLNAAVIYYSPIVLKKGKQLELKYRVRFHSGDVSPEMINKETDRFVSASDTRL